MMSVEIIYADRDIAVCIKPIGVLSENEGMPKILAQQLDIAYHQERNTYLCSDNP